MRQCEARYKEIAFDANPNISNLAEFEKLVKAGVSINTIKNGNNETALNHLAFKGKYEFIKILVENGIDVNIKDNKGETSLYEAIAYYPKHKDASMKIIDLLMDNGADTNMRRTADEKASILSLVVGYKLVDIVDELVNNRDVCSYERGRKYGIFKSAKKIGEQDIYAVIKKINVAPNEEKADKIKQILKKGGC